MVMVSAFLIITELVMVIFYCLNRYFSGQKIKSEFKNTVKDFVSPIGKERKDRNDTNCIVEGRDHGKADITYGLLLSILDGNRFFSIVFKTYLAAGFLFSLQMLLFLINKDIAVNIGILYLLSVITVSIFMLYIELGKNPLRYEVYEHAIVFNKDNTNGYQYSDIDYFLFSETKGLFSCLSCAISLKNGKQRIFHIYNNKQFAVKILELSSVMGLPVKFTNIM